MNKVLLEKRDGYAIVTLNRPDEMNALSRELRADFVDAFDACSADSSIRVVVVTGNGRAFCAGFDLKEMSNTTTADASEEADNAIARAMERFSGPIIGAINGHAITGGFEMALACDILIASTNARFADTHARVGILPGWGLSQKLPRLIGRSRAKEVSFTGAPVFAAQAYEWGLVNHVVEPDKLLSRAIEMAETICTTVPHVLTQYKSMIDEGFAMPYDEALIWEEKLSIESAKQATAAIVEARRDAVMNRGRSEKNAK